MSRALVRNISIFAGVVLCGGVCVTAAGYLTSPRGAPGPTVLQASSPLVAVLAVVMCVGIATLIAGVVGRLSNAAVGMFVLGTGLFVLASRLTTIVELVFANASVNSRTMMLLLALEALLWACLCLIAALVVFKISGPLRDVEPEPSGRIPHPIWSTAALKSAAAGVVVLPAVWVIAQSPMKGQMIGATLIGSMAAGLAGRLLVPNVQPVLLFVSPIVFGALGYLIAAVVLRMPLDAAYVARDLPKLGKPMPIDYAAGALWGVSWGLGWARSFLHHEEPAPAVESR
jgi:hypothetical protein